MQTDRLYPPGIVWWAVRGGSGTPDHTNLPFRDGNYNITDSFTLYEVLDVEKVFGQVVFARDMLR
jgi:hypothetical protein